MVRGVLLVSWLSAATFAAPAFAQPAPPAITAEPAPTSQTPPPAYAPPPNNAPMWTPTYERHVRPDRFFFALGVVVGGSDENNWLYGAYTGELAATILKSDDLRLRARGFGVLYGGTMESDWGGDFSRFGVGLEGRWCGDHTCVFADADVGYQWLSLYDDSNRLARKDNGVVVGPRFGFDFGGAIRARFALELYELFAHHTNSSGMTSFEAFGSVGLSFTLGYQL